MKANNLLVSLIAMIAWGVGSASAQHQVKFHSGFREDFNGPSSEYFNYNYRSGGTEDYRYFSGFPSSCEEGTDVMLYRIDPADPAGAGRGPEIISRDYTFYGSYSARVKIPDIREVQPNTGAVAGYFTYNIDKEVGQSEIDIEWLLADPTIIYVGTWTGKKGAHNRIGRIINLATGEILETIWRSEVRHPDGTVTKVPNTPFTGRQNKPSKIEPIEGFDASARFYTYGWDWYPDRLVWWIEHPETHKKIILWDYKGKEVFPDQPSKTGVPCVKSKYRFNFWHTDNWPVETNPNSVEKPLYPYELEIDWMAYEPFEKYNPVVEDVDFTLSEGWKIAPSENSEQWYEARVPSTVLGTLCDNGLYADAFVGNNYGKLIDRDEFSQPWWYVKEFELPQLKPGQHVCLDFEGISYKADIWLNGTRLASCDEVKGPFRQFSFDVTSLLRQKNELKVKVHRAGPGDFNIGFVDWNPRPADESMGIFRPVWLRFSNAVSVSKTAVRSKVDTTTLDKAWLTVETTLSNKSDKPVKGKLKVEFEGETYTQAVSLDPNSTRKVTLDSEMVRMLMVNNPRLWWCHNMGTPQMYSLSVSFMIGGKESDSQTVDFGIRQIDTYMTEEGHRGFKLNGKKILVKGAGWTDDIFLRNPDSRNEIELSYVKDMNLNAVRFENVWGTSQNVYDLCDRMGLLALVGWSCFWEWEVYSLVPNDQFGCIKSEGDMDLIAESFRDQINWLRNHPSIIAWYVGSDMLPRPELEKRYLEVLADTDDRPYIASAKALNSSVSGPTGMKMVGPYDYQAPSYWYSPEAPGGAFGFNTETGIGAQLPMRESIEKMIPASELWPVGDAYDYHCTTAGEAMHSLDVLKEMIAQRYGTASDLDDFLRKAHHLDYDGTRAMFEGFRVASPRSTGVIQWMLNSAWPSLYWQLYDWYLVPTASYWSVKKACAPQQLVYNYVDKCIYAVNDELEDCSLIASYELYGIDGKKLASGSRPVEMHAGAPLKLDEVPVVEGNSFLFLTLNDKDGREVQTNSYLLSSVEDITDWDNYNWIRTPLAQSADYKSLEHMKRADVSCEVKNTHSGLEVKLTNNSEAVAFFLRLSAKDMQGNMITPAYWSDNFISLKPGETRTVTCRVRGEAQIEIEGWNLR